MRAKYTRRAFALCGALVVFVSAQYSFAQSSAKRWHRHELVFTDSQTYNETQNFPNPFMDRRLVCTYKSPDGTCSRDSECTSGDCQSGQCVYRVQGFFNTDNEGDTAGRKFVCRFTPDRVGQWNWSAEMCQGSDVAIDLGASCSGSYSKRTSSLAECSSNNCQGNFMVTESDKSGRDFRAPDNGRLRVPPHGAHYLRKEGSGDFWVKAGINVGEGLFGYEGFDNTEMKCAARGGKFPTRPGIKTYTAHRQHYRNGDPNWVCSDCGLRSDSGKNIIGLINYLADRGIPDGYGANEKYLVLWNTIEGDTCDTYPWVEYGGNKSDDPLHFDTSKLAQWLIVLEHMNARGLQINAQLSEEENDTYFGDCKGGVGDCEGGTYSGLDRRRKLLYRELLARFGHLNAIAWIIGEENKFPNAMREDMFAYLKDLDPYDAPVSSHPGDLGQYSHFVGNPDFDGPALQIPNSSDQTINNEIIHYREMSLAGGIPWVVNMEEEKRVLNTEGPGWHNVRRVQLWPSLMGGGGYGSYIANCDDWSATCHEYELGVEDFSELDNILKYEGIALEFMNLVPFAEMEPMRGHSSRTANTSQRWAASSSAGQCHGGADPGASCSSYRDCPGTCKVSGDSCVQDRDCPGFPSNNTCNAPIAGMCSGVFGMRKLHDTYIVYAPYGGEIRVDLSEEEGRRFGVSWTNPRTGEACANLPGQIEGGNSNQSLGTCFCCGGTDQDALLMLRVVGAAPDPDPGFGSGGGAADGSIEGGLFSCSMRQSSRVNAWSLLIFASLVLLRRRKKRLFGLDHGKGGN